MNLAYLIAELFARYADRALLAENTRLTYRNEDLAMENEWLEKSRQGLIDRGFAQDKRITGLETDLAALRHELARRDSLDEDAAIERRNQAAEDRVAARDEDARKGWL